MGFRENLKSELVFSGLLVKELAAKSGIKKKSIDKYLAENGSIPSAEVAVKIAQVLGVSVEYLVTGERNLMPTGGSHTIRFLAAMDATTSEVSHIVQSLNEDEREVILDLARVFKKRKRNV